jgi:hypothetical protein
MGEFFEPDGYDSRFFGRLSYTAEEGVILDYSDIVPPTKQLPAPRIADVLYGYLDNGIKCTLVGKFSRDIRFPLRGGHSIVHGSQGFPVLVIGGFVSSDEVYSNVRFTLSGMQEFFTPKKRRNMLKLCPEPLLEIKTSYGTIRIDNTAHLSPLLGIECIIHSDDAMAQQKLIDTFNEIKNCYPNSHFESKSDLSHYVTFILKDGKSIIEILNHVSEIAGLFALLTCSPVHPEKIDIMIDEQDGHPGNLKVYPTMIREQRTIGLATMEKHNVLMPITYSNIDLAKTIEAWHTQSNTYSVMVSSIQHETGFRNMHSLHGEIVLYSTQLEFISETRDKDKKEKYDYPLQTYASHEVRAGLKQLFEKIIKSQSIGKTISDLRNEIAHVKKEKKLLNMLSLQDLADIARYLQMTIFAYILTELGIDHTTVKAYQKKFMPKHDYR